MPTVLCTVKHTVQDQIYIMHIETYGSAVRHRIKSMPSMLCTVKLTPRDSLKDNTMSNILYTLQLTAQDCRKDQNYAERIAWSEKHETLIRPRNHGTTNTQPPVEVEILSFLQGKRHQSC